MPASSDWVIQSWYRLKKTIRPLIKYIVPDRIWLGIKGLFPYWRGDKRIESLYMTEWYQAKINSLDTHPYNYYKGVNLIGPLQAVTGLGEAARGNIQALRKSGLSFNTLDFNFEVPSDRMLQEVVKPKPVETFKYNVNLLHVNPLQLPYLWERFGEKGLVGRFNIGVWYWELPNFPDEWSFRFKLVDEVWVASEFVRASIGGKSSVPVTRIPPCVQVQYDPDLTRSDFGLPENCFLFLSAFDILSNLRRKNPYGVIRAFKHAFPNKTDEVALVLKMNNAPKASQQLSHLQSEIENCPNCFIIDRVFPTIEFNSLLHLSDVYVSLHRSEGFGLIPAEAMLLGKPVIMTAWSGNVDYMTPENSCGVNYHLIPVGKGAYPYSPDDLWAEPDLDHAVSYMKKLCSDPGYYRSLSRNAKLTIQEKYSPIIVGNLIKERLKFLQLI